jgi:two-component system OmpR family sensor kinase/two-component system sensor histidine kinase BaeS
MRLRLFWTTFVAFVLVIVLGICGMFAFFGLATARWWRDDDLGSTTVDIQNTFVLSLEDYYMARNGWSGVDQRLNELPFDGPGRWYAYTLLDANGQVIASDNPRFLIGERLASEQLNGGEPIVVDGRQVGFFVLRPAFGRSTDRGMPPANTDSTADRMRENGMPEGFRRFLQGFLGAGLGLMGVLTVLALLFAGWLSHPIRRLTTGAQQLAAGKLDTRVAGARVRELNDLAESFNRMATSLSEADQQRRQLTADVAHELRTPLTIIKGRLEGLQDGVYTASPEEIERLLHETALLERLIEDLRVLALAEAQQLPLYPESTTPAELLQHTATAFADAAAAQQVALKIETAPDLPEINVDVQRLAQVLGNLVSNALRYTPANGHVTLRAIATPTNPTMVRLEVADTGKGIEPDELPHIFERFWRSDRSRARSSGGSGLGLAIARQIIVAHGGQISASSNAGHGTTIHIDLPHTRG